MEALTNFFGRLSGIVWGPVLIILLVGTGIFITLRMKLIQVRFLKHAFELVSGKFDDPDEEGEITHFQALSAALSATIGTGNIAGVGTAIAVGGPGAVFWMWVTAFFGMATKYASCLLSLKYRRITDDGSVRGGPMYYLEYGLKSKVLATLFAAFAALATFGIGNMVQANSVAEPLESTFGIPKIVTGVFLGVLIWAVIVGGIKRIGQIASKIVPLMSAVYVVGAIAVLLLHYTDVPEAFMMIIRHAFRPTAAIGGFAGSVVLRTIQMGVARGIFSNEAGLGSSPIAHAAARTDEPVREGLVAMLEPLIDTLIICTMTALVIIVTGAWKSGLTGAELTARAFTRGLPGPGGFVVSFGIIFFAFSTAISWSYYGEQSITYLFGDWVIRPYRWVYALMFPVGAALKLSLVWAISDVANALMALPNLIGILGLSGVVVAATRDYIKRIPEMLREVD